MLLRKHKLEKLLFENSNPFLIIQVLPMSTVDLNNVTKSLNKKGFDVKFLKTNETAGIMKKIFKNTKSIENIFTGNLILIQSKSNNSLLENFPFTSFFKENSNKFLFVGIFYEGLFYNSKFVLDLKADKIIPTVLNSLNQHINLTTNYLSLPLISIINILNYKYNL